LKNPGNSVKEGNFYNAGIKDEMDFRNLEIIEKRKILDYIINKFDLKPLPFEGGYFIETFRSEKKIIDNNHFGAVPVYENGQLYKKVQPIKSEDLREDEQLPDSNLQYYPDNRKEKSRLSRSLCTCILYIITSECISRLHRLPGEEIFHFYFGDPVKMLNVSESGKAEIIILGNEFEKGEVPQHVVKSNCWQGAFLSEGKNPVFSLLGTTMSPGFDLNDYESASGYRDVLLKNYPDFSEVIKKLT
jgi:predicted cupin superfamily sugar epimerase